MFYFRSLECQRQCNRLWWNYENWICRMRDEWISKKEERKTPCHMQIFFISQFNPVSIRFSIVKNSKKIIWFLFYYFLYRPYHPRFDKKFFCISPQLNCSSASYEPHERTFPAWAAGAASIVHEILFHFKYSFSVFNIH